MGGQVDDLVWSSGLSRCGSVLSGYDFATEKSGLGVALVTGHSAGQNAIQLIKEG